MTITSVTSKGQVTIPLAIRQKLGIRKGSKVSFVLVDDHIELHVEENPEPVPSSGFGMLKKAGESYGFEVQDTATLTQGDERVSSTRIREVLDEADFKEAERLLGRPYSIAGRVIVGQQLGRTLGVPTANMELHRLRSPLRGVFAVDVECPDGVIRHGVANVGTRPTVDNLPKAILEVHVLDFSGNLYRRNIKVFFRKKIRNEIRFDGLEALKAQIHNDIETARNYFAERGDA